MEGFRTTRQAPTLIIVDSHIGYGAPHKQDTASAHGEALGEEEVRLAKRFYGWPEDAKFLVPNGVRERLNETLGRRGEELQATWAELFKAYGKAYPDLAAELDHMQKRTLPMGWDTDLPTFPPDAKGVATRDSGGKAINAIAKNYPWMIGGAADLAPSTKTLLTFEGFSAHSRSAILAATCISASASTPWGRSAMASLSPACVPTARRF